MTKTMTKHEYLCNITKTVASKSTCTRKKVGAVFITRDYEILSTGYNGSPRGFEHCSTDPAKRCKDCIHAEQNAIVQAAKRGISLEASWLYSTHSPCAICSKLLINLNIDRLYFNEIYDEESFKLLLKGGIDVFDWNLLRRRL